MKKKQILTFLIAFLFVFFSIFQASTDAFKVNTPLRHEFSLQSGEEESMSFEVENTRDFPINVLISKDDYKGSDEVNSSLVPWVDIRRDQFILEPGDSRRVNVDINIPQEETLNASQWGALYVEEEPAEEVSQETIEDEATRAGAMSLFRYEIALVNTLSDAPLPEGEIMAMDVEASPLGFEVEFENTGSTFARPSGEVEVRDATGETVAEMDISSFSSYPGDRTSRTVQYEGPELEAGEYLVLARIDFGGDYVTSGQIRLHLTE